MVKHNNEIPHQHFHKDWDKNVKVWTDQAGRKKRRRLARQKKALQVAPRPIGLLRPIVRGQTIRYNQKQKIGRGFSLQELKAANVSRKYAKQVGIAVDHRRINESEDSLRVNVQRLKEYMSKLKLFKRGEKPTVDAFTGKHVMPIKAAPAAVESAVITEDMVKGSVYGKLRQLYADARNVGKKTAAPAEKK